MDQKLIAEIQVSAHVLVVRFPGQLHITATIVGVYIGLTVAARNRNRVPIGLTLAHAVLLYWLPHVGALPFGRGQHVSAPAQVTQIPVLLEENPAGRRSLTLDCRRAHRIALCTNR